MKRIICMIGWMFCSVVMLWAQTVERLHIQTDKDFYLAGEKMYVNVYGTDEKKNLLDFSKVAYVELLGDAFNGVRAKIALEKGRGHAVIELPFMLSSGVYELVGYTRWMRNEGEKVYFRKPIAVFNSLRYSETMDCLELLDAEGKFQQDEPSIGCVSIRTDKASYGPREKVTLLLDVLPEGADVSVSVVREDQNMPLVDWQTYQERGPTIGQEVTSTVLPELEGMLVESRYVPLIEHTTAVRPNLSLKGKELHYYAGQVKADGRVVFYTPLLEGMKEMVAGVESGGRLEMISPFVASPPKKMQPLHLYKEQELSLLERCMQVQADKFYPGDSIPRKEVVTLFKGKPFWSYDLDEYRRFKTFEESFLEFMPGLTAITRGDRRYIMISEEITGVPNHGNTLVFLDGVAVMDHEQILRYNPYFVKWVDVYVGQYVFGDQLYGGIVSMRTPNGWMPNFLLPENSIVVEYEGVLSQEAYKHPDWKNLSYPDIRHTLYWNPSVTKKGQQLECWTSDMCGTYIVKVEGLAKNGTSVSGSTTFEVKRP